MQVVNPVFEKSGSVLPRGVLISFGAYLLENCFNVHRALLKQTKKENLKRLVVDFSAKFLDVFLMKLLAWIRLTL